MKESDIDAPEPDELAVAQALSRLRQCNDDWSGSDENNNHRKERSSSAGTVVSEPNLNSPDINSQHLSPQNSQTTARESDFDLLRYSSNDGSSNSSSFQGEEFTEPNYQPQQQWRSMLLTATSLVLTRERRRKFRKMLSVLRLASEHLNAKVDALKETMEQEASQDNVTPNFTTVAIRNDIILTIKKCLAVLSTMATNSLPESASEAVRNHILRLPVQWANQLSSSTKNPDINGGKSESAVLALASETLVSIRKIIVLLSETLDRADSWVERLPAFIGKRTRDGEDDPISSPAADLFDHESMDSESPTKSPPPKSLKKEGGESE